jgi:hypothetical protein
MPQSLPSVILPRNKWVDLYAETGITIGTSIIAQNTGKDEIILTESLAEPVGAVGHHKLPTREFFVNSAGNIGAWALSSRGSKLQVEEA